MTDIKDSDNNSKSTADDLIEQKRKLDNQGLLQIAHKIYVEILSVNLTKSTYHIMQYDSATTKGTPPDGNIDDMINIRIPGVVPDDRDAFIKTFSQEQLRKTFITEGKDTLQLVYRRFAKNGKSVWFETTAIRQNNPYNDDVILMAVSRIIDQQKAKEIQLEKELKLRGEEIRLTMTRLGKYLLFYDVPASTLSVPISYAKSKHIPEIIHHFPECINALNDEEFEPATLKTIQDFYNAIRRGEPSGICELYFPDDEFGERWERMEFANIFDEDGIPVRAVIFLENVTSEHSQAKENLRLKENERILRLIAQHSERTMSYYDISQRKAWSLGNKGSTRNDDKLLPEISSDSYSKYLTQESKQALSSMYQNIYSGVPEGTIKLAVQKSLSDRRWYEVKYSTIFDDDKIPVAVLFSHNDITRRHERDLAYQRQVLSLESNKEKHLLFIEGDLSSNSVDVLDGRILPERYHNHQFTYSELIDEICDNTFFFEKDSEARKYFSYSNLLKIYSEGQQNLKDEWHIIPSDGVEYWIDTEVTLLEDTYTHHIKVFIQVLDITKETTEQMAIKSQSECDGMTGLLNRATAEERISKEINNCGDNPGILLLMDLDNLKGINDTFGHEHGDRAIKGIANVLKEHFRETDIIGRLGGDEFIVYLKGAAGNKNTISLSLATLLRKLASISIGPNDEQRIHCSIGCSVKRFDEDNFETLYKRADLALYHVKRNGKNSYAFFTEEMTQADYQFKRQKFFEHSDVNKMELDELQYLVYAVSSFYPIVLSANLSTNNYLLMEAEDSTFAQLPNYGSIDDLICDLLDLVHTDDRKILLNNLSRQSLLQAYASGEKSTRCYVRQKTEHGTPWVEIITIFYLNNSGDVCDFTLMRWAAEREHELNNLWLKKILDIAVSTSFEYICIVDIENKNYYMYGNDGKNTHTVPTEGSFDKATIEIRDYHIAAKERESYYKLANIDHIIDEMKKLDDGESYSYQYSLEDGLREASFYWFEPSRSQLLMTVRHLK